MKMMRIEEVCEYLQIGRTSFYNYKQMGLPVHKRPGVRPFCYKEEIDEWLKDRERKYDRVR